MTVETTIQVTLTQEELNAVKIVHNMLAHLADYEATDLNNALPPTVHLSSIKEGLTFIYELATNGDMSELD